FGITDQLKIEGVAYPETVQEELTRICREEIFPPILPLIDIMSFDNGRRVVVLEINGKRRPYRTRDGRFYIRIGEEKLEIARHELSNWLDEIRPLGYENIPIVDFAETDFDDALLWSFASAFGDDAPNTNLYQTANFLKKDLLLAVGNAEDFLPTIAGILLFGKNEKVAEIVPRSSVTFVRYAGENTGADVIEKVETNGNLLSLYESALQFLARYCDLRKDKPSKSLNYDSPVQKRAEYHLYAVREAVANALIHRDLAIADVLTRISIFDSAVEIINPRRTNGFAPPASRAIRYGITQQLNPQIAAVFTKREYGTSVPKGGLPMLLRQSQRFSGKRTELYTTGDEFKLRLYGV
ncbi:MAG: putative DNA binding domain-containing protein, partial [Acidobacteriota bacterium]|nr:putative DNA binding domain-containing protein [Acidobacteriota bacterium]